VTKKKRLVAVGAVCAATIYRVPSVPPLPAKVLATEVCPVVDGMAISAACAFVRLGGSAQVWARTGDDAQTLAMRAELAAEGLDVRGLHAVPGSISSSSAIIVEASGRRLVVPLHDPSIDPSPHWLPLERLAEADFLHCDPRWVEGAEAALHAARQRGLPCMIDGDVAPVDALKRLVPLATHAVFSDAGLLAYAACDDVETALRRVAAEHDGHVGATCGAEGYLWVESGSLHRVAAPAVEVIDTLSAGDVFHGAFALALLEGRPIAAAARFACVAASLKCGRFGGRLGGPTRAEVDAMLSRTATGGARDPHALGPVDSA
jgi:sulfofructose kinase